MCTHTYLRYVDCVTKCENGSRVQAKFTARTAPKAEDAYTFRGLPNRPCRGQEGHVQFGVCSLFPLSHPIETFQ